jgi:hypothetical protein
MAEANFPENQALVLVDMRPPPNIDSGSSAFRGYGPPVSAQKLTVSARIIC